MDFTERLLLPMLIPGQAQKEIWHNESLERLDIIVASAVEEPPRNDPPTSPAAGSIYIVGDAPTGEWGPYASHLAAYSSAGWRFIAPVAGLGAMVKATGSFARYQPTGWEVGVVRCAEVVIDGNQVVGPRDVAISDPVAGPVIDAEARSAIGAILSTLRKHGLITAT